MKKISTSLFVLCLIALLTHTRLNAQCTFTPTINEQNVILCPNDSSTLTTQVYDHYQWYLDGQILPGDTLQSLTVYQYGNYHVIVTLDTCVKSSDTVLVDGYMFAMPTIGFDRPTVDVVPYYLVPGDSIGLIAMTYLGNGSNFKWTNSGMTIPGAVDSFLIVKDPGYYALFQSPALCPDFYMFSGVEVEVVMCTPPGIKPVIVQSNDTLYATNGSYYRWSYGFTGTMISMNTYITPTIAGDYYVATLDSNGCQVLSLPYSFVPTAIEESSMSSSTLNVYPNPASGKVTVKTNESTGSFHYAVLSLDGKVITQGEIAGNQLDFDASQFSDGIYLIRIQGDNSSFTHKLVIQH